MRSVGPDADAWRLAPDLVAQVFTADAVRVLAAQWFEANQPKDDKKLRIGVDFSRVEARRDACAADPAATSNEAEGVGLKPDLLWIENRTLVRLEDGRQRADHPQPF